MSIDILAMILAAGATPTSPPPAPVPAASPSPNKAQAAFDAAMAAYDAGRFDEAIKAFADLEARPSVRRAPQVHGTILLRMGTALAALDRTAEAEATLRQGLATLPPGDTQAARVDRYGAYYALGDFERYRLNYVAAAELYRKAIGRADEPLLKARALLGLARVLMFDDSDEALRQADEAYRVIEAMATPGKDGRKQRADVQTIRARIMLNQGRATEAYALLRSAVTDQGGLDLKVNYNEIVTRADLALAALLANKLDDARLYLAYTGAGRFEKWPFDTAAAMGTPPCGGPAKLKPEDIAVIEFFISPEGVVRNPTPIYASTKGPAAVEFARAVADWSWKPADAAKIPDLFRVTTRVEMRCSTGLARPDVENSLFREVNSWLAPVANGMPQGAASSAADLAPVRAELDRRRGKGGMALIPPLLRLGLNPVLSDTEQQPYLVEARDLAVNHSAPPAALAFIEVALLRTRGLSVDQYRSGLRDLTARSGLTQDAVVADTLRLMTADPVMRSPAPQDAGALLQQVIDDSRLPDKHPLKVGALIRLAALQAQAGDRTAAEISFNKTGMTERQCALLDAKPALLRDNASSSNFPMAAMYWRFEGWVRIEYDIDAEGKTAAQRAVIAYPPFVFRDAAVGIAKGLVYTKSFRPDGSAGCGGQQQTVRFTIGRGN